MRLLTKISIVISEAGKESLIFLPLAYLLYGQFMNCLYSLSDFLKKEILRTKVLRMIKNDPMVSFCSRRRISCFFKKSKEKTLHFATG